MIKIAKTAAQANTPTSIRAVARTFAITIALSCGLTVVASANVIPTSFLAEHVPLKRSLRAGDLLTAELHANDTCSSLVAAQTVAIDDVEVREFIKPYQVRQADERSGNSVRLHFTFHPYDLPAGDYHLSLTSEHPDAVVGVPGDCQPQAIVTATGAVGGGMAHENRSPYLGLRCIIAVSGFGSPSDGNCATTCLGDIRWTTANSAVPDGWSTCDGQILLISQYSGLFTLLGITYGGDGRTTFGLPDLRGRSAVHAGNGAGLDKIDPGERGGSEEVTLTVGEMPVHAHR